MTALPKNARQNAPLLEGKTGPFSASFELTESAGDRHVYTLKLTSDTVASPPPMTLRWTLPNTNIKGVWTSGSLYEKRLRADWEPADRSSSMSVNAPVVNLFGHRDENRLTFAWSDAVNTVTLAAPVREEDNLIYCRVELFTDGAEPCTEYTARLLLDYSDVAYDTALAAVGHWWEAEMGRDTLLPAPAATLDPIYSTWYSYHQEIDPGQLLKECRLSRELGYSTIIVDDGWQTMDNQRGYDYTGDWLPERFTEMRRFVDDAHGLGMKVMIWYSVPFCGPKSKAYQRFKGKFLTEDHRWAPVFDPRYPEVRDYLVGKYRQAVSDWNLDGLKLDFIDDFRIYKDTPAGMADGRDFANVNAAVVRLVDDITAALTAVRPDILIEFRQQYVGPELRRLGNLFRAFDCPNDSATNRLRTTDVRLIGGSGIVTSDMVTWHAYESVDIAALQLNNILFSVPQISVRLAEQRPEMIAMIRFWTGYYNDNRDLLMGNTLRAVSPLENYPLLSVTEGNRMIVGLYGSAVVHVPAGITRLDVINGRMDEDVVLHFADEDVRLEATTLDCQGAIVMTKIQLSGPYQIVPVPASGLLRVG